MKNKIAILAALAAATGLLTTHFDIDARGGGGGGRSSGAGAYRGGQTMNRTPTMSRASSRPAASRPANSQVRRDAPARPSASQARVQQPRQASQQRPSSANRTELRDQVNRHAQDRGQQNANRQSASQRAQNFSGTRSNQLAQNRQLSDRVSQRVQQSRPNSNQWFDRNFFDRHDIDIDFGRAGINLWRPAAWASLAAWGGWGWSTPYYYDDVGDVYPISPSESTYVDPYSSTTASSQSSQTDDSTGGDWLPLGVYALASSPEAAAQTDRFLQLAINRNGELAGVLYNSATDQAYDITGTVNTENQKAFWALDNRLDSPIASTGIYNLTEDQTPINIHFTDGSDQTWTLVRLQQRQS